MRKPLLGAALGRSCAAAVALLTMVAAPASLPAQTAPPPPGANCVEVVPAQPGAAPAILLDRCSGQTWQLLRSSGGRYGARYAWYPLNRQEGASAPPRTTSAAAVPAAVRAPANSKCFSFNGRTFCE